MEGLIFGAICVAWLIYLVPWFLGHRGQAPAETDLAVEELARTSMTIVRAGSSLADALPGEATVTTPLTRRAVRREVRRMKRTAAMRRRRVVLGLVLMLLVTLTLCLVHVLDWMWIVVPSALLVVFFVLSPISVVWLRRRTDAMIAESESSCDEATLAVKIVEFVPEEDVASVSLAPPVTTKGSLWDPIPVTAPTYMSQPLAPRTVRTIDLTSPLAPVKYSVPVPDERTLDDEDGSETRIAGA